MKMIASGENSHSQSSWGMEQSDNYTTSVQSTYSIFVLFWKKGNVLNKTNLFCVLFHVCRAFALVLEKTKIRWICYRGGEKKRLYGVAKKRIGYFMAGNVNIKDKVEDCK